MERSELVEKMAQAVFEGDHQVNWFQAPDNVKLKYRLFSSDALQFVLDNIDEVVDYEFVGCDNENDPHFKTILKPTFRKEG